MWRVLFSNLLLVCLDSLRVRVVGSSTLLATMTGEVLVSLSLTVDEECT